MTAWGAYGLRLDSFGGQYDRLVPVPAHWPLLRIETAVATPLADAPPAGTATLGADAAELWLRGGDRFELTREPLALRITTAEPLTPAAVLHPYLGLPAAIAGRWLGRTALHGGAFAHAGRAWALVGDREAGKSATLGQLQADGVIVVSDDILIIEGGAVYSGPRSVDLREEAAAVIGGEDLGVVGARRRWRLRPAPSESAYPLEGIVLLEWGEETRLEPVALRMRLPAIIAGAVLRPDSGDRLTFLALASLPVWRFVRRPGLERMPDQVAQLLEVLSQT